MCSLAVPFLACFSLLCALCVSVVHSFWPLFGMNGEDDLIADQLADPGVLCKRVVNPGRIVGELDPKCAGSDDFVHHLCSHVFGKGTWKRKLVGRRPGLARLDFEKVCGPRWR